MRRTKIFEEVWTGSVVVAVVGLSPRVAELHKKLWTLPFGRSVTAKHSFELVQT